MYIQWLSRGVPTGQDGPGRGFKRITRAATARSASAASASTPRKCALCHGKDGEGTYNEKGETVFPPLWGPRSFNIGAGMARVNTAAAFVKANMPFGQDNTLTDQEAFDVSAFFTHQPRPDFSAKRAIGRRATSRRMRGIEEAGKEGMRKEGMCEQRSHTRIEALMGSAARHRAPDERRAHSLIPCSHDIR